MKQMIHKELLYAARNSKIMIIGILYVFFAFSVPVMVKVLLPAVLKSQFPGMSESDLAMMIDISQFGSMTNYLKNMFEVGMVVVVFTLSGIIASEIKDNTLVMPICSGRKFRDILFSKFIVYSVLLFVVNVIAMILTYVYSGLLFEFDITFMAIIKSSVLESLLLVLVVALLLFYGTFFKKPIPAGLTTIGTVYLLSLIGGLFKINDYVPTGLHIEANTFTTDVSVDAVILVLITVGAIVGLLFTTLRKLHTMEWNQR